MLTYSETPSPTKFGWPDVHAPGKKGVKGADKTLNRLKPVTLAVMLPSVAAARAVVDKMPREIVQR